MGKSFFRIFLITVTQVRHLLFCVIFLLPYCLLAQDVPMLHYSIENGLPSNTIYDLYQDPDGFVWIGTDKGIARYNGHKFEIFTTADGLSDNECFFFKPDYNGRLWIGTANGELCYYKDGVFHNPSNTSFLKLPLRTASLTRNFIINADSTISVFCADVPDFYEIDQEKVTHISNPLFKQRHSSDMYFHIRKIKDDVFEFFYRGDKVTYNNNNGSYQSEPYSQFRINTFTFNRQATFFITEANQVYSEDLNPVYFKHPEWFKGYVIYKLYDDKGNKILATSRGVVFDGLIKLLPDDDVHAILKDANGDYWLATAKNGIHKVSRDLLNQVQIKIPASQSQPVIFADKKKNYILYATKDRFAYRVNLNNKQTEVVLDYSKGLNERNQFKSVHWVDGSDYYNFSLKNNFKISDVWSPYNSKIQKLKLGDVQGAYKVFATSNYHFLLSPHDFNYALNDFFNGSTDSIQMQHIVYEDLGTKIYGAAQDSEGMIWFSTINNVYKLNDTIHKIQKQFGSTGFREFIFLNGCFVGITHRNELLFSCNYRSNKVIFDTLRSNDCVWGKFYKVNDTTLFISTNNYFRILNVGIGAGKPRPSLRLLENPFVPYQPDHLFIDSAQCYFFKNTTMISFSLNYLLQKPPLPNLKFSSLKTSDSSYYISDTLSLNYNEAQNVRILFTPITFDNTNLSYEYSIVTNGKNANWYPIEGEELNLVKLGFGEFTVELRAKTMSGEYSQPRKFLLMINKPYWASWWFIVACVIVVILVGIYLARIWSKRKLKKKEAELRFLKSEYKALNALMNPHFIFNSLNSVQGLVNNNEITAASKYIRIFSDLIRQNMHNISNDLISLEDEMELVENYIKIEQLRLNETLHYHIEIADGIESDLIMVPPLLIQPLVENAIKHGIWPDDSKDGFIQINIYEEATVLFIEIKDNGIGLRKEGNSDTAHKSYAMTNIKQRIEQLSMIHKIEITVTITEMTDAEGTILGVRSLVTLQMKAN